MKIEVLPTPTSTACRSAIQERNTPRPRFSVRALSASQIDSHLIDRWEQLEDRAVEPNPFLSPHFVLPAIRRLTPKKDVVFLVFESEDQFAGGLAGLGVFERSRGTLVVPFPHWCAYATPGDTFMTNLLVDRSCSREVLTTFFEFLVDQRATRRCVEFTQRTVDSPFGRELEEIAGRFGMRWIGWQFDRPMLRPSVTTPERVDEFLSRNRRKKARKLKRQLESLGKVTFDVVRCGADVREYAERFLRLEDRRLRIVTFLETGRCRDASTSFPEAQVKATLIVPLNSRRSLRDPPHCRPAGRLTRVPGRRTGEPTRRGPDAA